MPVQPKFRNVICPWQSEREIKNAEKFITAMLKKLKLSEEEERKLLLLDRPDWVWIANGKVWK